jgi:hypothetical protein
MKQCILAFLILAFAAIGLPGCPEHEPQALWAQANIAPDESCEAKPLLGSQIVTIPHGFLDLAVNNVGYTVNIQLMNLMGSTEVVTGRAADKKMLENNNIHIQGAQINYDVVGLSKSLPQGFFQFAPNGILPGEVGVMSVNVIPTAVLRILREEPWLVGNKPIVDPYIRECFQNVTGEVPSWKNVPLGGRTIEILVRITFEGTLQNGEVIRSNEFRFPLTVCSGCLIEPQVHPCNTMALFEPNKTQELLLCDEVSCNPGQDNCYDMRICFVQNFYVDGEAAKRLSQCAQNPAFPPPNIGVDDGCAGAIGPYVQGDLANLEWRYSFERVNAYCFLSDEAPVWPTQP